MNLSTSDLRPSVRSASRGSSYAPMSSALAASMRLSRNQDSPDLYRPVSTYGADVEHLELRQDLIDRESLLLLQQQRERLTEAQLEARRKEEAIQNLEARARAEMSRSKGLESSLARVSTKKMVLERENEEQATKLELERLQNSRIRREKLEAEERLRENRERLVLTEEQKARAARRASELEQSVALLEQTKRDNELALARNAAEAASLRQDLAKATQNAQDTQTRLVIERQKSRDLAKRLSQALQDKTWAEAQLGRFLDERIKVTDAAATPSVRRSNKIALRLRALVVVAAFVGRLSRLTTQERYDRTNSNDRSVLQNVSVPMPRSVKDLRSSTVTRVERLRSECDENYDALQSTRARADSDLARANTRISNSEAQVEALRSRLNTAEARLDAESSLRSNAERELLEHSKARRSLEIVLQEKERELTRSQIEHREKDAQLSTTRRVVDALAQENLQKEKEKEAKERELRDARVALDIERSERELKARQRLHVLEDRAVLEENVASQVDRLADPSPAALAATTGSLYSSGLSYSKRASLLASPLAVSRASGKMTKGEIKQLINTLDKSIADSPIY